MGKNLQGQELKQLQSYKQKLELELQGLKLEQSEFSKKINILKEKIDESNHRIEVLKRNTKELIVSEHAILRYLERIYHLDMEKIKQEIVPKDIDNVLHLGNATITFETHKIKVIDNIVITILEK